MKANGTFETGKKEGEDFYAAFGKNDDAMLKLGYECAKRQDTDPEFRAMNANGVLMSAARKVDPLCQANESCKNR